MVIYWHEAVLAVFESVSISLTKSCQCPGESVELSMSSKKISFGSNVSPNILGNIFVVRVMSSISLGFSYGLYAATNTHLTQP